MNFPQVKICGLTSPSQAKEAACAGADAVGLVFYEKSPRCVSAIAAGRIAEAVNGLATPVGVTVNMAIDEILCLAMTTGISVFQLHGSEPPEYIERLKSASIRVIKHISDKNHGLASAAERFNAANALLIECGEGQLPGGNGAGWDWAKAKQAGSAKPFILAGGLTCENVSQAVRAAQADAVDVSSAVEAGGGNKDMKLVEKFIANAKQTKIERQITRIF